ncbi:MAG TPA: hypothetical protein LFW21_06130 [Rickettsia endosymbiont of Pyrocoelia pectoralis]|nr:hypothetical protein [Rickettsia endosymbiont of Pyrocoelia pectoralis]
MLLLKKYLLFFLFLFCSLNVHAGFWGTIGECITDPCNCGRSDRTEIWNKGTVNEVKKTFKPGTNCPPWNRTDGRDTDNCLLQFDYPGNFTPFLLSRCAEEPLDSSYFTPKIRIRIQSCNAAACWSQSSTLNWDGECILWPTGYGLPLTRVCARVAVPAMPPPPGIEADAAPADPGYTEGFHLNRVGYTESDNKVVGTDGQILNTESPKLCAYSDPGLVNLVSDSGVNTDAFDWDPYKQPLHQTTKLHPIPQVLAFLVETAGAIASSLPNMLGDLLGMIGPDSQIVKILQSAFNAIGKVIEFFADLVILVIQVFGSLNGTVDNYSFGCINLPLGPFPPPFCKSLSGLSVNAVVNNICSIKNPDGTFNQSSTVPPCVVSNVRNNVINNTMRVSFNNLVPLCTGTNPDLNTCVQINNLGPFSSANGAHTATAFKDFIKPCSNSSGNAPCINTNIPLSCSVSANGCDQGFRIVYAQVMGSVETPSDYFISDIPDCGTGGAGNSASCQKIWGVNVGEFVDVSVKFPTVQGQDAYSLMPVQQNFTLHDNNKKSRNLYISVSNTTTDMQDLENVCLFESGTLVSCVPRVNDSYSLAAYECSKQYLGITCPNNTYYTPQFIAAMQVTDDTGTITDETATLVTPLSLTADPDSFATESIVMLAGYNHSSSVAFIPKTPPKHPDDQYIAMPFSGPNALNQFTIHGVYKNNEKPYDQNGKENPNAVYLKYLEYLNGKYVQGGTHACLMPKNFQHCSPIPPPSNPNIPVNPNNEKKQQNCVLAKLNQTKTADCAAFKSKLSTYPNLSLCDSTSGCSQVETISGSGKGVTIYKCGISNCYVNNDNPNPNTPVCVLSRDYLNRENPLPSVGPILDDTQYYKVQFDASGNPSYDTKNLEIRDKTWQELNLCARILVPVCNAVTSPQDIHGNAIWPETDIGELAQGTCPQNWVEIDLRKKLERYCISDFNNKNVAFEPLGKNVGCRESKGLPVEIIDNTFPTQLVNTPYDKDTLIGDFILNVLPEWSQQWGVIAFPNNLATFIDASNEPGGTKLYTITFKVTLDAMMDDIEYFKILDLWYDDCTLVYVNGTKLLSAPIPSIDSLDSPSQCNNGQDQGQALQAKVNNQPISTNNPIDIRPYLQQGENYIKFQLRVMYGGGLYYHMQYKMKR